MPTASICQTRDVHESRTPKQVMPALFLDCPPDRRADTERELAAANVKVVWADSSAAAIAELQRRDMPVLVSFWRGAAALKFVSDLRAQKPGVLLFAVVEADRPDLVTEAVLAGVADVLTLPVNGHRLATLAGREAAYVSREVAGLPGPGLHDIFSFSPAMRDLCALVARAATARSGVLVRGEDGTGRHMVARAIHAADKTRSGRFVAVDCAAFEAEQLEKELFGAAARTDDDGLPVRGLERISRTGRLHDAVGGTLYLQNVVEASSRVRRRLARLLRDREAVGDDGSALSFDVRCIASADVSMDAALHDGRVDDALYRRLSANRVDVPLLRNRREDIPALANYFLRQTCAMLGVPVKMFSRSALALLSALPFCGNAAELRELLHTIVSGLGTRGIGVEDVLAHVRLEAGAVTFTQSGTLRQARARFEHEYIVATLRQHRGRITQAAKTLGIQRTNLYRKMRTLKVAQPRPR